MNELNVAVVGTANVAQTVKFIAEHERSTNIKYFVLDDAPQIDILRGADVVFMLTALDDAATCKTAHLIADCVKNVWLSVAIVQSASNVDELRHVEETFGVVINLAEQQFSQTAEDFSYKIVHGIHSIYDEDFYPYLMPMDFADMIELFNCGKKTFVSFGEASGEKPSIAAVNAALDSPPVKENLQRACSVFVNIIGSCDSLLMLEANEAATLVYEAMNPDGNFYFAVNLDEALGEKIFVMIVVCVSEP